jgi:4-coumarate--CoA ligase
MVVKSPYPLLSIPNVDIPTFLFEEQRHENIAYPRDREVLIDAKSGRSLSLNAIHDQSRRFGQGLKEKWNWKKGDVLCIFSINQVDTGVVIWGTHYGLGVGASVYDGVNVVSPANPAYTEDELLHQLTDSGAIAIVTMPELLGVAVAAGRRANIPAERIILFREGKDGHKHYTSLFSERHAESTRGKIDPEDLAILAYSSGTTGLSKGVMLTHRNLVSNILQGGYIDMQKLHWTKDRMISFLPFYHI